MKYTNPIDVFHKRNRISVFSFQRFYLRTWIHPNRRRVIKNRMAERQTERLINQFLKKYYRRQYYEALEIAQKAVNVIVSRYPSPHYLTAICYSNLAKTYLAIGNYHRAKRIFQQVNTIWDSIRRKKNQEYTAFLNCFGVVFKRLGEFDEAERVYEACIRIEKRMLGSDHPEIACDLVNLGELKRIQAQYDEAEQCYKRALNIFSHHPVSSRNNWTIMCYNNLAFLMETLGRYEEAEAYYESALTFGKQLHGEGNLFIVKALDNLANLYHLQERYHDAEQYSKEALAIRKNALKPEHPRAS